MDGEVKWVDLSTGQVTEVTPRKKLPYVSTWANFDKMDDEEKKKVFNSMRGELITNGLMEDK